MTNRAVAPVHKVLKAIEMIMSRPQCRDIGVSARFGLKAVLLHTIAGRIGIRPQNHYACAGIAVMSKPGKFGTAVRTSRGVIGV